MFDSRVWLGRLDKTNILFSMTSVLSNVCFGDFLRILKFPHPQNDLYDEIDGFSTNELLDQLKSPHNGRDKYQ